MMLSVRRASFALAFGVIGVSSAPAQISLADLLREHTIVLDGRGVAGAFDDGHEPSPLGVRPGALAMPLAVLRSGSLRERTEAAYAFGALAGESGRYSGFADRTAAVSALVELIASPDRRARIAGARVIGRVLAVRFDLAIEPYPNGVLEALFALLNQNNEVEQLAAMDALGLIRASTAVTSLTERYWYYRNVNRRALAGGALEALARISDPSTIAIVKQLVTDHWGDGKDATALAVAFARARLLNDASSMAVIRQAMDDKSRRIQAIRYSHELTPSVR